MGHIVSAIYMHAVAICILAFSIGANARSDAGLIAMVAGLIFFGMGICYMFTTTKPVRLQDIDPDYNPILRKEEGEEEIK